MVKYLYLKRLGEIFLHRVNKKGAILHLWKICYWGKINLGLPHAQ